MEEEEEAGDTTAPCSTETSRAAEVEGGGACEENHNKSDVTGPCGRYK